MVEEKNIPDEKDIQSLTLDKKTMDVLVANIIPTSKYFEVRFDHMQDQISRINNDINSFHTNVDKRFDSMKIDMDQRFEKVDQRFEKVDQRFDDMKIDMDKRFEKVDQRFEKVDQRFDDMKIDMDKRFEQMIASINRLTDKLENRDDKQRGFTLRMFTIAISISFLGALGTFLKSMGVI